MPSLACAPAPTDYWTGVLGVAGGAAVFVAAYGVAGLCQGAMMPAANTVIAAAVPYERRGAAFGLASSVQALAFVAGPLGAAYFAAVSLSLGFVLLGSMVGFVALITLAALREPDLDEPKAERRAAAGTAG